MYYDGCAYVRRDLPVLIQIVVLLHEVGHHLHHLLTSFLFRVDAPVATFYCLNTLWVWFFEVKDTLICRKWMVAEDGLNG